MLFNSLEFLVFFPTVVCLYFIVPLRFRWMFLLGASYYFYMSWKPEYLILILISTGVDYLAARGMGRTTHEGYRKGYLILSLVTNLSILFTFKYFNFFGRTIEHTASWFSLPYDIPTLNVVLPVGISFYTFQTLSYTIDVYRGEKEPETHLGVFALYVAFFPQLVAGPIERSTRLLPQFFEEHSVDWNRIIDGAKLMLWGFFKKIVIADRLAIMVDQIYNSPHEYSGIYLIVATYFFAFQIFCDFSGYSDIAIGAAQILGFDLMENFQRPYFSKSIPEFWRRWHISLSTWFKDYLYIPLGGNRVPEIRFYFNIFMVFFISGLWHGAAWTFAVWGILHGVFYLFSIWTNDWQEAIIERFNDQFGFLIKCTRVFITFHLVTLSWIFFRANTIDQAFYILQQSLVTLLQPVHAIGRFVTTFPGDLVDFPTFQWSVAIISILFMEIIHLMTRRSKMRHFLNEYSEWLRWVVYYVLIFGILLFGKYNEQPFIYFQF